MVTILFTIFSLPFLVIASSNINNTDLTFHQKCNPLLQCNAYFSVAGFAEVSSGNYLWPSVIVMIFLFKVNWLEANHVCNRVGAVLATVRNEEQHQLMLHYVNRKGKLDKEKWHYSPVWPLYRTDIWKQNLLVGRHKPGGSELFLDLDEHWHSRYLRTMEPERAQVWSNRSRRLPGLGNGQSLA